MWQGPAPSRCSGTIRRLFVQENRLSYSGVRAGCGGAGKGPACKNTASVSLPFSPRNPGLLSWGASPGQDLLLGSRSPDKQQRQPRPQTVMGKTRAISFGEETGPTWCLSQLRGRPHEPGVSSKMKNEGGPKVRERKGKLHRPVCPAQESRLAGSQSRRASWGGSGRRQTARRPPTKPGKGPSPLPCHLLQGLPQTQKIQL